MQRDQQFLLDVLQSAELVLSYTSHCSKELFTSDVQLQDSVIRRLLVIAEASKRISDTTKQSLPNIAWSEINGMRNRMVHEYDDIDLEIVWVVIRLEIPSLIEEIKPLIPPEIS